MRAANQYSPVSILTNTEKTHTAYLHGARTRKQASEYSGVGIRQTNRSTIELMEEGFIRRSGAVYGIRGNGRRTQPIAEFEPNVRNKKKVAP